MGSVTVFEIANSYLPHLVHFIQFSLVKISVEAFIAQYFSSVNTQCSWRSAEQLTGGGAASGPLPLRRDDKMEKCANSPFISDILSVTCIAMPVDH